MDGKWCQKKSIEAVQKAVELESAGMSYRKIAAILGVSKGTINNWLNPSRQTEEFKSNSNKKRQNLRNHKYNTDPIYRIKQLLRVSKAKADRRGYISCLTSPDIILSSFTGICYCCCRSEDQCGVLCIDHCHKTGIFRAWLCHDCNRAIGLLQDNPIIIAKALSIVAKVCH